VPVAFAYRRHRTDAADKPKEFGIIDYIYTAGLRLNKAEQLV